ncbi:MoxR family ATPase [Anaerosalibacter bizertensis]|uniref:MoxR family ATPase n=1 Tax=Anaerosalibacter bizertensis TaxID=932217 RepID=A0A9Q4FLW7_9FIRM|nr:MoxR family ATPase [Anaerosalibacter bizertensis]MCB5558959.1 MoxR family ATPase [Anaerosalibacter bizertensis]MCG4565283.1 MoxR family ATPase [Anaerosalibacter bizertensis]MCG4582998.1 MoxR family ATPase [Anaerosalibacter bizertensis]MCG4584860.1 MoxR family ATPase [Anaerosalibacter bizertensis]
MDNKIFVDFKGKIIKNVSKVVIGKDNIIELLIVALISGGHVLLEDIPGVGKTMLVKAFAKTLGLPFKRIQFTPDLLPSDITGINYFNQKIDDFQFRPGPLFVNIVLADEINRATPRTQSSLLEAMEEKQITVDGETRVLNIPFMVLATQNPVESYGTFPLPEAQLDRFFMRISMGYPTREEEKEVIFRKPSSNIIEDLPTIVSQDELDYVLNNYGKVKITEDVMDYILDIVEATRNNSKIQLGVSPRGSIALFKACQSYAAINGRDYIIPEDVKKLCPYVFNHRILIRGASDIKTSKDILSNILKDIKVPVEEL